MLKKAQIQDKALEFSDAIQNLEQKPQDNDTVTALRMLRAQKATLDLILGNDPDAGVVVPLR